MVSQVMHKAMQNILMDAPPPLKTDGRLKKKDKKKIAVEVPLLAPSHSPLMPSPVAYCVFDSVI